MKILQVGQTSQDAGVENAVRLICSGLSRANHSVRLVTDSAIYADEFAQTGVQYSVVDLADRSPPRLLESVAIGTKAFKGIPA